MLRPNETDRTPRVGVTRIRTSLMLCNTPGEVVPGRAPDVERVVGAAEHVDEGAHIHLLHECTTVMLNTRVAGHRSGPSPFEAPRPKRPGSTSEGVNLSYASAAS